jgi:hypothetical protein
MVQFKRPRSPERLTSLSTVVSECNSPSPIVRAGRAGMFDMTLQHKTVAVENRAAYRASQSVVPMGSGGLCTAARILRQVILACHTPLIMLAL